MIKISDLIEKEVVNTLDGKVLGIIIDLDVDLKRGRVNAIIVPEPGRFMGIFGKELEYEIRWNQIKKIGEDVILVELPIEAEPVKAKYYEEEVIHIQKDIKKGNF